MKNLQDVLQIKQKQLAGLRREVEALELAFNLCRDEEPPAAVVTNTKPDLQAKTPDNLQKVLKSWP